MTTDKNPGELTPEQIAYGERMRAEYAAAGGFHAWVLKQEAARIATEAKGYPVPAENFKVREHGTTRELLDQSLLSKTAERRPCCGRTGSPPSCASETLE